MVYKEQVNTSGDRLCNKMGGAKQGVYFINNVVKHFINHFLLKHVSSITYYP
jgi:hypothetical protein